jgi:hypothetical protein
LIASVLPVRGGPKRLAPAPSAADNDVMLDWHDVSLDTLADELRATLPPAEAEKMLWAFEQVLAVARIDGDLLRYHLAAVAALLARAEGTSPRAVFEAFFRRSVSDDEWRDRYAGLLT